MHPLSNLRTESSSGWKATPLKVVSAANCGNPVCRLGLASRGGAGLTADDVHFAIDRGITFLNWPGEADSPGGSDGLSDAIASLGPQRESLVICVQFGARTATDAAAEL